jgi:hypothetical protein
VFLGPLHFLFKHLNVFTVGSLIRDFTESTGASSVISSEGPSLNGL